MAKYKVGDELLIINDPTEENEKLKSLTKLTLDGDYAQISWGLKIVDVEYEKPYVTLTYTNVEGELNKVFAECIVMIQRHPQTTLVPYSTLFLS